MQKSNLKKSNDANEKSARARAKASSTRSKSQINGTRTLATGSVAQKTSTKNSKWNEFLKQNPDLNVLFSKGIDLRNAGKPKQAVVPLRKAVLLFPKVGQLLWYLGTVYLHDLEQPSKALPFFRKASQLNPKSEAASKGVFHSLWDLDRRDEALEEVKRFQILTNWSCQDYLEIMKEIEEKLTDEKPTKKTGTGRREKRA